MGDPCGLSLIFHHAGASHTVIAAALATPARHGSEAEVIIELPPDGDEIGKLYEVVRLLINP